MRIALGKALSFSGYVTLFDPIIALIKLGFSLHCGGSATISDLMNTWLFFCDSFVLLSDEGWPLGLLQPVNARARTGIGSISFNTLLTASPSSSTDSSSDLDTQSTGSFFRDQSTTLGSLMGVSSIVELSRRSLRESKTELFRSKKKLKLWSWCFCLGCEGEKQKKNAPSLAQFLAVERRVANENRRNQSLHFELALAETDIAERNSLFINGTIAPPHSISSDGKNTKIKHANNKGFGSLPELFSCMCGQVAFF
ncbi:hypothetical protein V8G54_026645 [Vigna mungo]|uniref:Uncharacterized protein n=1 Tax=Vigna mungo TaxID=3915 RepID=A0AAQ3N1E4_VIGMU